MIAITDGIFKCVAFSRHERNWARALCGHGHRRGPARTPRFFSRPTLALCARAVPLRARSRSDTGFREPGEQTSDSGGERKMEVRVGERLLYLAVLSSVFCVDLVLGKYVKGIVNTKEVSVVVFFFTSLISCDNDTTTDWGQWERDSVSYPHAGVSVADCAADRPRGYRQITVKLPRIFKFRHMKHTHLCSALQLRAIYVRVISGVYVTLIMMVFGTIVAPVSGVPPVHGYRPSVH